MNSPTTFSTLTHGARVSAGFSLLAIYLLCVCSAFAHANIQHTKGKPDQTIQSNARVNPSTLAVEMSIPIADLPGHGGASMPLVFSYSSKVWELRATGASYQGTPEKAEVRPTYSDMAMAGWTSSYGIPRIETTPELYDCNGFGSDILQPLPSGCGQYRYVKKMRVILPGGTNHELRKDDLLYTSGTPVADLTGKYVAVDGSRVRLEWGSGGTSTLFMPDGGRYLFDSNLDCTEYLDRNGNKLTYYSTNGTWTDTMGPPTSPAATTPRSVRRPRQPALYDPVERIIEAYNRTPS